MGFIYTKPVKKGLINITSTRKTEDEAASLEQIIKAIDDLKGNTEWRSSDTTFATKKRCYLQNLINLTCLIDRGQGEILTTAAMQAGAPGVTICYAREIGSEQKTGKSGRVIRVEKEIVQLIVAEDKAETIADAMLATDIFAQPDTGYMYMFPVNKALTYLGQSN